MRSIILTGLLSAATIISMNAQPAAAQAHNPLIWADVPDVSVQRVGDTYYMSSTTGHMSPGVPVMQSKDLVNWTMASYAYDVLEDADMLALRNGKNSYGSGSWASSLRFHDGKFVVSTFANNVGKTFVYTTDDPLKGPWKAQSFKPSHHDHSLVFDDDGRVYMTTGAGDIRLVELNPDLSGDKPGGFNQVIIKNASEVAGPNVGLKAEGSQVFKANGKYYVFLITWPRGGMRTELCFRADKITGPYEGRVVMADRGIAQGGIFDTPDGKWYAMLFRDYGAVGRVPYLIPMKWEDGWPVIGENGKAPDTLPGLPEQTSVVPPIVASDEFERKPGEPALPLVWQWNHNPVNEAWSITERPGHLRLKTPRVATGLTDAPNSLTQRVFGPQCSGSVAIDVSNMKNGDVAGLAALQKNFGYVGVKMIDGQKTIVMVNAERGPTEVASVPLTATTVHLRTEMDFKNRADRAAFYYSLDGTQWKPIGNGLRMSYTIPHFVGYRFALFNYATQIAGGTVDFDYFRVTDKTEVIP